MDNRIHATASHVAILAAAAAVMAYQIVEPGYYILVNFDAAIGPKYTLQFIESFRQGILYPRWMAENFFGFGSPTFVFYSPLLYFLTSILSTVVKEMPLAFSTVYFAGLYMGGVCMFHFVKRRYGNMAGLIAALCFILTPSRIADFYLLNSLAGRFAQSWLPAVLLSMDIYLEGPFQRKRLALVALSYAGLVMSHIATAFIFTPFLIAFGLFGRDERAGMKQAARLTGGVMAGLCVAAIYFLPAIAERTLVQIDYLLRHHNFLGFFVFQFDKTHGKVLIEGLLQIYRNTVALEMIFALVFTYLGLRNLRDGRREHLIFFAVSVAVCFFMMSSPSRIVWQYVPGLATTGYPARFGAVLTTFLPALIGVSASRMLDNGAGRRPAYLLISMLFVGIIAMDIMLVKNSHRYTQEKATAIAERVDMPEYLPKTVDLETLDKLGPEGPILYSDSNFDSKIIRWDNSHRVVTFSSASSAQLRIRTFYFPGWRAWVDGVETAIGVEDLSGAMLIDMPPGTHEVELRFTDTPPRTAGKIVSTVTLLMLLFPSGLIRRRHKRD